MSADGIIRTYSATLLTTLTRRRANDDDLHLTAIFESTGEPYVVFGSWSYREEAEATLPIIADLASLTNLRIEFVESLL
jgi:hypothetical protein